MASCGFTIMAFWPDAAGGDQLEQIRIALKPTNEILDNADEMKANKAPVGDYLFWLLQFR
jgi:hypothetical protein